MSCCWTGRRRSGRRGAGERHARAGAGVARAGVRSPGWRAATTSPPAPGSPRRRRRLLPWRWLPAGLPGWNWRKRLSRAWRAPAPARPAARSRAASSNGSAGNADENSYAFSHRSARALGAGGLRGHRQPGPQGHRFEPRDIALAVTSPLQAARVDDAPRRLEALPARHPGARFRGPGGDCRAGQQPDARRDDDLHPAASSTGSPPRWPSCRRCRTGARSGVPVFYTIDAGPNVHVLCPADWAEQVAGRLGQIPGVQSVLQAAPGGAARLV